MNSLYTPQVAEYIRTRPWPKGLVLEVLEYDEPAPHLKLILFRDNWITLSRDAHWQVTTIIKEVMDKIRADGIPIYLDRIRGSADA